MPENQLKQLKAKTSEVSHAIKGIGTLLLAMAVIFVGFHIWTAGQFLTVKNVTVVLSHAAIPALIAYAICFLFTTGYSDLSLGAILILASNCGGELAFIAGYPGMIIGTLAVPLIFIQINIQVTRQLKIPSWISGIGMAMVYEAIMGFYNNYKVSAGMTTISLGKQYRELGTMPFMIIIAIFGLVITWLLLSKTKAGINLRAIGSNSDVAQLMGINENKTIIIAGIIGAFFLGIASALNESYAGRTMTASGLQSISMIFKPLAIFLLAEALEKLVSLPIGIFLCSIVIAGLFNCLTWLGVPSGTGQEMIMGFGIVLCAIVAQRSNKGGG